MKAKPVSVLPSFIAKVMSPDLLTRIWFDKILPTAGLEYFSRAYWKFLVTTKPWMFYVDATRQPLEFYPSHAMKILGGIGVEDPKIRTVEYENG
ncbi:MAG: hypothetical protein ACHQ1H_06235 [Nitrososphaerales archaeon]